MLTNARYNTIISENLLYSNCRIEIIPGKV